MLQSRQPSFPIKQHRQSYISEIINLYYGSSSESFSEMADIYPEFKSLQEMLNNNPIIRRLFNTVMENYQMHAYKDALFFIDKLITLTKSHTAIIFLTGECYYQNGDFKKVHSFFAKNNLTNYNQEFQLLAVRSLMKSKQHETCLTILDMPVDKPLNNPKLDAAKLLIKAQCHEAQENKIYAVTCYFECLKKDPVCVEAFNRLIDCFLLSNTEQDQLLSSLNFNLDDLWVKKYYMARIKSDFFKDKKTEISKKLLDKFNEVDNTKKKDLLLQKKGAKTGNISISSTNLNVNLSPNVNTLETEEDAMRDVGVITNLSQLKVDNVFEALNVRNNIDVLCIKAKNAFAMYDIGTAYDLCIKAIQEDPLYFDIIPIYCACLLEFNSLGELYSCAHNLVENHSTHPLAWYAVGVYYFVAKKYEIARKYFQKATNLDRNFTYSWIGFAHSFAIQDESDQAMAVYRTCARLFPGCYSAHLYIGMEYLRTNNLKSAYLSFEQAKEIKPNDPLIHNEIGVIFYKERKYADAKERFLAAQNLCDNSTVSWVLETICSNLAHTFRKLKEYKTAIKFYERCISLNPKNPNSYFSLAFTYHISNEIKNALIYYHKSLHLKYDNQFVHDMLARCLQDAADMPWENVYKIAA